MKEIALIVPKGSKYGKNKYLKNFLSDNNVVSNFYGAWETPNLSLLTIAGLIPKSYKVRFIDEDHGENIPFDYRFDMVALTGMTQQIYRAYEIIDQFKQCGVYTVIGGIHATIMPDEASQHADTVIVGEGETAWLEFLDDYEAGVPKYLYQSNQFIDLQLSPTPRYDLLNKNIYSSYSIQTTRGCPRTCNYCTLPVMYGSSYRIKNISQIINEVRSIKKIDSNPFIFFADDNMFINKEHSKRLLAELREEDIKWGTQSDISVAEDEELLELIKNAGCHWLFIGLENVYQKGLSFLDNRQWKASQVYRYEKSIEKIHNSGINIWASFMFGGDNDTTNIFDDTIDFAMKNGIYSGSFTILTPLPGTQLFKQMEEEGRIIDYDWSRYTFWDVIFQPKNMTSDELAKGVAYVYDRFYSKENVSLRTTIIKKRLRRVKKQNE